MISSSTIGYDMEERKHGINRNLVKFIHIVSIGALIREYKQINRTQTM